MITNDKRSAEVVGSEWNESPEWSIEDSERLYDFNAWGGGHFGVSQSGEVVIQPGETQAAASIFSILDELRNKNLRPPFLLRFPQLLERNVKSLHDSFEASLQRHGYKAGYKGVFPVKVNQTQMVVEAIHRAGQEHAYGLEAGSKAELCAVLTIHSNRNALILCNGFKDGRYLEAAMLAKRLGKRVIVICEQYDEIERLLNLADDVPIEIGIRCRLNIDGTGI
ncbi:MAG: arginine decarboxylase, partial [Planctomycetota bacterium]|nr:arginine decarboxylase [Planctomycetota bacterium]